MEIFCCHQVYSLKYFNFISITWKLFFVLLYDFTRQFLLNILFKILIS